MNDFDVVFFENWQPFRRVVPSGFNRLHTAVDDDLNVFCIWGRCNGWKESQIHAERLVCQFLAFRNFFGQIFWCSLRERCDDAQTTCIGNGRCQLSKANKVHAALNDRVLNVEEFCDSSFHCDVSCGCCLLI